MTKKQALATFRAEVLPGVRAAYERDGRADTVARREAWNNWTDALCKDRQITSRQYDSWDNPF
jgi:hypothetical protein